MRKILLSFFMLAAFVTSFAGSVINVQDSIYTNTTWTRDNQYLIKGYVYVVSGTTLTINPGTVIKGDKNTKGTLIIEPGAKIIAAGTAAEPIIFTSNQNPGSRNYGDWGGLILAGNAPTNNYTGVGVKPIMEGGPRTRYGGTDPADSSGVLQYVRVEYSGVALSPNNEVNGVTFYAVGNKTVVDHVMVSFGGDDSFEWFGGTVNCKYLIANRGWDDDFDTDNGYSGMIQFAVGWRDPNAADFSGSKGFESDNDGSASNNLPMTSCVFSNITLVGPVNNTASYSYDPQYVAGVHIRRNSGLSLFNSVVMGWPCGILIDGPKTGDNVAGDSLRIKNTIVAGIQTGSNSTGGQKEIIYVNPAGAGSLTQTNTMATDSSAFGAKVGPLTWFWGGNGNKKYAQATNGVRLTNPFNYTGTPSFVPTTTSPIYGASPAAPPAFTDSKLSSSFFTQVGYIGAFGSTQTTADDWTAGWASWDPQYNDYPLGVSDALDNIALTVYPNPTKGLTTVKFTLNRSINASISVVDMKGMVLSTLPAETFLSGTNEINFDASGLTQGVYLLKIVSENTTQAVRFTVY
ncbi:MAG: T9SS type A sorting domain-containing protein [Cytophagaceae bacterium]|nr:T9SS type A sorting domain-containing protein [Cytophagaceae bacterium]